MTNLVNSEFEEIEFLLAASRSEFNKLVVCVDKIQAVMNDASFQSSRCLLKINSYFCSKDICRNMLNLKNTIEAYANAVTGGGAYLAGELADKLENYNNRFETLLKQEKVREHVSRQIKSILIWCGHGSAEFANLYSVAKDNEKYLYEINNLKISVNSEIDKLEAKIAKHSSNENSNENFNAKEHFSVKVHRNIRGGIKKSTNDIVYASYGKFNEVGANILQGIAEQVRGSHEKRVKEDLERLYKIDKQNSN